jgi:multiple sugar transport system permease protein
MSALQLRSKRGQRSEETPQGLVSFTDWNRRSVKYGLGTAQAALLVLLVVVGLGPILWLAKAAVTPTQDTLIHPMAVFPHGTAWSNVSDAWSQVDIGLYLWNTIAIAFGSWVCQIIVATTGAYALSVLRPKWGNLIMAALLTTLFVPTVVLLVPLYIEIVHPPLIGGTLTVTGRSGCPRLRARSTWC